MNNSVKIMIAGLVGAAAGTVAGVLLAPDEGKKTRKKISKKVEKVGKNLQDLAKKGEEILEEAKESVKETVNQNNVSSKTNKS